MSYSDAVWAPAVRLMPSRNRKIRRRMGLQVQIQLEPVAPAVHAQDIDTGAGRPGKGRRDLVLAVEQIADAERCRQAMPFLFGRQRQVRQPDAPEAPALVGITC